ncbi:hypothetical protein VKT23_010129 [Stygiomarasmius scandens]|uniref:DUF6534 domain-containing protein n=1 Tax=Marasmiellus scandens TaxID=2682957 RepID=A0ABR1JC52_9AGAR
MTTNDSHQDLEHFLGPIEIGVLVSSVSYGVVLVQTYKYFQASFRNDSVLLKCTVACLCVLQTVHSVLLWDYLYNKTVTNFTADNISEKIFGAHWSLRASFPVTAIITLVVQTFFTYQVRILLSTWYYPALMVPALLIRFGLGIARGIVNGPDQIQDFFHEFKWLIITSSVLGAAIDITNTIALSIAIDRNYSPLLRSRNISDKLVMWTIETGLITSIYSTLEVILLSTMKPNRFVWIVFWMQAGKLYSNAILSFLNGRISLRSAQAASHIAPGSLGPRDVHNNQNLEVHIEMESAMHNEISNQKMGGSGDTLHQSV